MDRDKENSIIKSLAEEYSALYCMDFFTDNTVPYQMDEFAAGTYGAVFLREKRNFFDVIDELYTDEYVYPEDRAMFRELCNQESIYRELKHKKSYSIYYRVKRGTDEYEQYKLHILKVGGIDDEPVSVILGFINCNEQALQEQRLKRAEEKVLLLDKLSEDVYIDSLTGALNRRAYEEDTVKTLTGGISENAVFITADVNGLKAVNDNIGHDAGDEIIRAAGQCLLSCFGESGKVYRVGGDEFFIVAVIEPTSLEKFKTKFSDSVRSWRGKLVNELSVSVGYAPQYEFPEAAPPELVKYADKRMYQDKAMYYARKGVDRRSNNEIYKVLVDSYTMVLKVDLAADSYRVIKTSDDGLNEPPMKLTECFGMFGVSSVAEEDREYFREKTDINFLRNYFSGGNKILSVVYRAMTSYGLRRVMMEFICASEGQIYLLIKDTGEI